MRSERMVYLYPKQRRKVLATLAVMFLIYILHGSIASDDLSEEDNISVVSTTHRQRLSFNSCEALQEYGAELPYTFNIPLETSIKDVEIEPWVDAWFANGVYDSAQHGKLRIKPIDFVFTWVNGSDVEFVEMKEAAAHRSPLDIGGYFSKQNNRFREWDELRYAIRSVFINVPANMRGKIYLVVPELESLKPMLPTWLNEDVQDGLLRIVTHPELFDTHYDVCLPTFDSNSIEAALWNVPDLTSDTFCYTNDDMFFVKPISSSDVYTELYGNSHFMLNLWRNPTVRPSAAAELHGFGDNPMGEYASWLLSKRFGFRRRRHVGHFQRFFSARNVREAQDSFPQDKFLSPSYAFRYEGWQAGLTTMIHYHYDLERHREALLWSYIALTVDDDRNGFLNVSERVQMKLDWEKAMSEPTKRKEVRPSLKDMPAQLHNAGLDRFKIFNSPYWSSLDGSFHQHDLDTNLCFGKGDYSFEKCFGTDFTADTGRAQDPQASVAMILDKIGRDEPLCGDCLIHTLLRTTPRGLEPILPKKQEPRQMALKALYRYRYLAGRYESSFHQLGSVKDVEKVLVTKFLDKHHLLNGPKSADTAHWSLLCLNDDISTTKKAELDLVQGIYHKFFTTFFPIPSPLEKIEKAGEL